MKRKASFPFAFRSLIRNFAARKKKINRKPHHEKDQIGGSRNRIAVPRCPCTGTEG
jgi:hypothetical protein